MTDTFEYDTYGKVTRRTGISDIIFLYNGRDGVVTDDNGLIYMRARYYSPEMRRFINADILAGDIANAVTLNRYAYANANPVSLIDPNGLSAEQRGHIPTALEAAYMAKHIYAPDSDENKKLEEKLNGLVLNTLLIDGNGFRIGVYIKNTNGKIGYTIVNKGSSTWNDWGDNLSQPFGMSSDMKRSIELSEEFCRNQPDSTITFVGHSKGGAEAAANAVATNNDAILFNPATVNLSAYNLNSDNYDADITAYIVEGEALNSVFGSVSTPIDNAEYLKEPFWKSAIKSFYDNICVSHSLSVGKIFKIADSINKHSMDTIIDLLE